MPSPWLPLQCCFALEADASTASQSSRKRSIFHPITCQSSLPCWCSLPISETGGLPTASSLLRDADGFALPITWIGAAFERSSLRLAWWSIGDAVFARALGTSMLKRDDTAERHWGTTKSCGAE